MSDPLLWRLVILAICILINAFFTLCEIALISLNDNKIRYMADEGHKKAKKTLSLLEKPSKLISTTQICVTLAGFLASAFAASSFAGPLTDFLDGHISFLDAATIHHFSLVFITIILSYVTLVFGELVPKQIGWQKSEIIAFAFSDVILLIGKIFNPVIWLLTVSTNAVLRLFGLNPSGEMSDVTEEEIRMMVDIGEETGSIAADEKELITNVFEFNNKEAADVMTHRIDLCMIWIEEEPEVLRQTILESGFTRYPVYHEDADDIVGILHLRDYLANMLSSDPKPLKEVIWPAYFIPEHVRTDVLFRDMQREKIHLAVVLDEYGGTSGIVTMEDLVEEIFGNIYDEYDETPETIQKVDDTTWRVPGSADLEELEEILGIRLPQDDFDTLGGLFYSQLRNIPKEGDTPIVEAFGLRVQVEKVLDRRVEKALVSKFPQAGLTDSDEHVFD